MRKLRVLRPGDAAAGLPAVTLFGQLWGALVDLLGTAATAALLTRAARRARARWPELGALSITRVDNDYAYVVPPSFHQGKGPSPALRELAVQLRPLLVETTGELALRHLDRVPELRTWAALAS